MFRKITTYSFSPHIRHHLQFLLIDDATCWKITQQLKTPDSMVHSIVQYCYSFLTYFFSTTPTTCSNKWQRRSEWSSILQNFKNMIYYIQADRNNNDTETRCLVYIQGPILLIAHKRPISLTVLTLYLTRYVCLICWKRVKGTINPVIVCSLM